MIFNSLGSNYNLKFALRSLLGSGRKEDYELLSDFLGKKYHGRPVLLYKGREAIFLALRTLNLPHGSAVAVNGYTCYAVYKAIADAGLTTEYLDVPKGGVNFSVDSLEKAIKKNPDIKVVIVQNTFGFACEMEKISIVCKRHGIFLIEDLAHSPGAVYADGKEVGTVADFTAVSFSQDKMVDAVSGGALIIRNDNYQAASLPALQEVVPSQIRIDRWYPMLTWVIRKTYAAVFGKVMHAFLKQRRWLAQGLGDVSNITPHKLPHWHASIIRRRLEQLDSELFHRKQIAQIYFSNLDKQVLLPAVGDMDTSSNLRFPIVVEDRAGLINHLKGFGIHVSDIWYDAPVAPKKLSHLSNYRGQCPNSEVLSRTMLNLPTHINVSLNDAKVICSKINAWLKLQ